MNPVITRTLALGSATLLLAGLTPARAEAPRPGVGFLLGYRSVDLDYAYTHDTHPDDAFLADSGVPGSAGTTELGRLSFLALGVSYRVPVSPSLWLNLDAGGLIGDERDEHQNANDQRPAADAAYVYSKATWGAFAAAGLSYHRNGFYVGAEAQLNGVRVESGWDRYGADAEEDASFELQPSIGPKVGYAVSEQLAIEASAQFGETVGFGAQLRWRL